MYSARNIRTSDNVNGLSPSTSSNLEKKQRKYTYKANFTVAAHVCRLFLREKTTSPNLETIIARNIIPVRPNRHRKRILTGKVFHSFLYRVA